MDIFRGRLVCLDIDEPIGSAVVICKQGKIQHVIKGTTDIPKLDSKVNKVSSLIYAITARSWSLTLQCNVSNFSGGRLLMPEIWCLCQDLWTVMFMSTNREEQNGKVTGRLPWLQPLLASLPWWTCECIVLVVCNILVEEARQILIYDLIQALEFHTTNNHNGKLQNQA